MINNLEIQNNVELNNNMSSESIFKQENNVSFEKLANFEMQSDCIGIGKVASVIEKVMSPRMIKKNADALAYALPVIEQAINNSNIPENISINIGGIEIKSVSTTIGERALDTLIAREINKQINSEEILSQALEYINHQNISDEDVDEDWLDRFFQSASNISSKELQLIWSKILANEIERPSNYSLRTLDILKNMSKKEAELFKNFTNITLTDVFKDFRFTTDNVEILQKYGITRKDILLLKDIGLVDDGLIKNLQLNSNFYLLNDTYLINIDNISGEKKSFGIIHTTSVGTELSNIILQLETNINKKFIDEFIAYIKSTCPIDVKYGKDYNIIDNTIHWNEIDKL